MNKTRNIKNKIFIFLVIIVSIILLIYLLLNIKKFTTKCEVYPVSLLNQEYLTDELTIDANVCDLQTQQIYLDKNQIVKEVLVKKGQEVKAGTDLLIYDKQSQQLSLQIKELEVKKAELNLQKSITELENLKNITPVENLDKDDESDADSKNSNESEKNEEEVYTTLQLKEAIDKKNIEINENQIALKRVQLELSILKKEVDDGVVRAKKDGVVTIASDPNNPPKDGTPFLKVSSGIGFDAEGSIPELTLSDISVGDKVSASNYETGDIYEGTITNINDFPSENDSYYNDQNSSYYGFKAHFDDDVNIQVGTYIQLILDSKDNSDKLIIPLALVRNDSNGYYVMKNSKNKLKKVYIKIGKTLYGEYVEINDGLKTDDYIAFPYGKKAKENIRTIKKEDTEGIY